MFVLPLLRENKTPGCPIQRALENDFVRSRIKSQRDCQAGPCSGWSLHALTFDLS
jgi:hypothetical protein